MLGEPKEPARMSEKTRSVWQSPTGSGQSKTVIMAMLEPETRGQIDHRSLQVTVLLKRETRGHGLQALH